MKNVNIGIIRKFGTLGTSNVKISEELFTKSWLCVQRLKQRGVIIGFAESCTGGLLTCLCCMHPGASAVVECGLVTYSNAAKEQILGVSSHDLEKYSSVSEVVAVRMAEGLLSIRRDIDMAVSITGVAGNSLLGEDNEKDAGCVFIAQAVHHKPTTVLALNFGTQNRNEIQCKAAAAALDMICNSLP